MGKKSYHCSCHGECECLEFVAWCTNCSKGVCSKCLLNDISKYSNSGNESQELKVEKENDDMTNNITVSTVEFNTVKGEVTLNLVGEFSNIVYAKEFAQKLVEEGKVTSIGFSKDRGFVIKEGVLQYLTKDNTYEDVGLVVYNEKEEVVFEASEDGSVKISGGTLTTVKDNSELITSSYKNALEAINNAIEAMQTIQTNTSYSSAEYREALKSQVTLENTKLELIRNELVNVKSVFGRI